MAVSFEHTAAESDFEYNAFSTSAHTRLSVFLQRCTSTVVLMVSGAAFDVPYLRVYKLHFSDKNLPSKIGVRLVHGIKK
jgi:hypothetical protein